MKKIVFIDTETTGLHPELDEPWEIAWIVRDLARERDTEGSILVEHNTERAALLPPAFKADYEARWKPQNAVPRSHAAHILQGVFDHAGVGPRPCVVGLVPSFDTVRLERMMRSADVTAPWHYQIKCLESMALGWITSRLLYDGSMEWSERATLQALVWDLTTDGKSPRSDALARALGVEPDDFDRHQGLGDCRMGVAMWDAMFGSGRPSLIKPTR